MHGLLFLEHAMILGLGIGSGSFAALIAILPQILSPVRDFPLGLTLVVTASIALNGGFWVYLSSLLATRGNLLTALRDE
jgi:hypothetical protein